MSGINRDAWLKALEDVGIADNHDKDALTILEFCALMGLRETSARRRLHALAAAGKARRTTKRMPDKAGRLVTMTAYRLLETKPAKRKGAA